MTATDFTPASRDHLENSRPISWDRVATTPKGKAAVAHVVAALDARAERKRARRADDRRRLEATVEAMLMDLYVAAKASPGRYLAYSRRPESYTSRNRYANPDVTRTSVVETADFLVSEGLAEGKTGSYARSQYGPQVQGRGYLSRLRATSDLVFLLDDHFSLRPELVGFRANTEVLRLKDAPQWRGGPKPLLDYRDTPDTMAMRESLHRINSILEITKIQLEVPSGAADRAAEDSESEAEGDPEDRPDAGDRSRKALYRVFNNGSWEQGGRFYGGWWIALAKELRPYIIINGSRTVELDYKCMHPRLCYHLEGIACPPDADLYAIPGLTQGGMRDLVKKAFSQLINAEAGAKIRAPGESKTILPKGMKWSDLLVRIEEYHAPIRKWFRNGKGLYLQFIESRIAEAVLSYFAFRGFPVLPIHDGFVVRAEDEYILGETMMLAYSGKMSNLTGSGRDPAIGGWSSPTTKESINRLRSTAR